MLEFLRGKASERKLRLFDCACCRLVWHLLEHAELKRAVESGEQFADGLIDHATLVPLETTQLFARLHVPETQGPVGIARIGSMQTNTAEGGASGGSQ